MASYLAQSQKPNKRRARAWVALSLSLATALGSGLAVEAQPLEQQSAASSIGAIPDVHGLGTSGPGSVSASSTNSQSAAQPAAAVSPSANSAPPAAAVSQDANPEQSAAATGAVPETKPQNEQESGSALGAIPDPLIANDAKLLKATISADGRKSPLLFGSVQYIPKGTNIDITLMGNLNSEVSQKGDEVWVRVAQDVQGSGGVGVPGGWYMHGLVTDSVGQKRLGRNGYISVEFDSLVSPDGEDVLPFHASISTKDSMMVSAIKETVIDGGYVSYGALGGAILSLQLTGIGTAIATHGISVGAGAAVGGTLGAIGALKRKGKIASLYPGDDMKIVTAEPISLPAFNKAMLPSAQPHPHLANMQITVNKAFFSRDPMGDRSAHLLTVDFTMINKTRREFSFMDLAVVSDHQQRYTPSLSELRALHKTVKPDTKNNGVVTFPVDSNKRKYWLVLVDRAENSELTRVPITSR